jgi:dTDP-4-amino-4,6-dideoxygalactose transaminase
MEPILCSNPKIQYDFFSLEIDSAIRRVLESDKYILGPEVSEFETEFANYLDAKYCIGVNSGTDALIMALKVLGIGIGDEVILPSHTAVATASAIKLSGAAPVFADISLNTYTLEPNSIVSAISKKTKAIIAVHLYGQPCDMDAILEIAGQYNLFVIEDCAQAHGATWRGKKVGTIGDIGCFSFYPTKNLGAIGDGGAIVTNDVNYAEKLFSFRQYGWDSDRASQFASGVSRLDEIQAAVLRVKLKYLDDMNLKRRHNSEIYSAGLQDVKCTLPNEVTNSLHVFHLYVIRISQRDEVKKHLESQGIYPGLHYRDPVHVQPGYVFERSVDLSNTMTVRSQILSLPMYPELNNLEVDRVVRGLMNV